jgi:hypothetical protein
MEASANGKQDRLDRIVTAIVAGFMIFTIIVIVLEGLNNCRRKIIAREKVRSELVAGEVVPVYGFDKGVVRYRIKEVPLRGPIRGEVLLMIPEEATNVHVDYLCDGLCSFFTKYEINGKVKSKRWNGVNPTLREGVRTEVLGFEVILQDKQWEELPPQYSGVYVNSIHSFFLYVFSLSRR